MAFFLLELISFSSHTNYGRNPTAERGTNMSDYNTGNSASVYNYGGGDTYECYDCRQTLRDAETYEAGGRIYCGTCYQGKN